MCGIVAVSGPECGARVSELAGSTLARLEYRGYDSFGFAVADARQLSFYRSLEPLAEFDGGLPDASAAIGHTRWATHGGVTLDNCHPHVARGGEFAVVHSGIVENHQALRRGLESAGAWFDTATDTEVIARLLEQLLTRACPASAMRALHERIEGRNAVVVLFEDGEVYALRAGSPLILGGDGGRAFVASDSYAFEAEANLCMPLADGQIARLHEGEVRITAETDEPVATAWEQMTDVAETAGLEGYRHYMLKEIMESWLVVSRQLQVGRLGL